MIPIDELHTSSLPVSARLRKLTWIKARLVLPPVACMIAVVIVIAVAELATLPEWLAFAVVGGLALATFVNHYIAANALCPNCRLKFFWTGRMWNTFRINCPHCGFGPPSPHPLAVASGYLGLISPLVVPAPFALVTSIACLRRARRNPGFVGKGRAIFGLIMGLPGTILIVLIVVAAIRS